MILMCYDGSGDAGAAIEQAGLLLDSQPAAVLTVWQPFGEVLARTPLGFGFAPGVLNIEEADNASRAAAERVAADGAKLARQAGFNAQPRACIEMTTTAGAILSEAESVGAKAIVMGSRGLSGLKSLLLGSVSHAVLQGADRTVIVVPSPAVAGSRNIRTTPSGRSRDNQPATEVESCSRKSFGPPTGRSRPTRR
jgi:nucleotide-binding universal stress UspA family protein